MADGLKPEGAIYKEAMRRSELLQQQKLEQGASAIAPPPSPVIQTPPVHMGGLRNLSEVAMNI